MIIDDIIDLKKIILHFVGNKQLDEILDLSATPLFLSAEMKALLTDYFLTSFNEDEFWQFHHDTTITLNEVFTYVSAIFDNPDSLQEQSENLAKHLYEQSSHPKIKGGEFCVAYFKDCILEGETLDAVGLFKSENKDNFLKVITAAGGFQLISERGINLNKLDKGCLIFNTDKENGYVVSVVDRTNRNSEAQYWINDFLHVKQRQNDYFNTNTVMSMCKEFVVNELPKEYEISKADQADLLNKSLDFFKENLNFDFHDYHDDVIQQPDIVDSFKNYRKRFQIDNQTDIPDKFELNEAAVKKKAKILKSIIKLDKNFHIYVHGDRKLIEQGEDDKGKFYKMYYEHEE